MVASVKTTAFWDVVLCSLMVMEEVSTSETLINFCLTLSLRNGDNSEDMLFEFSASSDLALIKYY